LLQNYIGTSQTAGMAATFPTAMPLKDILKKKEEMYQPQRK
jgi:hypothetical protein